MSKLPTSASVATPVEGAKLSAPSALRNLPVILKLLQAHAPVQGRALEIASGTGQHITALAQALPGIDWFPTEISPERIASIDAYATEAALPNLRAAQILDAAQSGWSARHMPFDLTYLGNLLHLIPQVAAQTILEETANALAPSGTGDFLRPLYAGRCSNVRGRCPV